MAKPVFIRGIKLVKNRIKSIYTVRSQKKFSRKIAEKIVKARKMIDACEKKIYLEVDGGVTAENICMPLENGADVIVAGSSIFGANDASAVINKMRDAAR